MTDLYVPGLDLLTGLAVDPLDKSVPEWRKKGHNGDRTLVCLECYLGSGWTGGPRMVPLVPKGKEQGARQPHFAHPPGMAPAGGRHSPESEWHWQTKHRLCQWARSQGAAARVEVRTADGRRRSDVSVLLPGGEQLAIEVQYSPITDAEILARHQDYARVKTAVTWVWRDQPPHVLYRLGEPGWLYNPATSEIGLACGKPHQPRPQTAPDPSRTLGPHCPPCPGDEIDVRWTPLTSLRLTADGLRPPPEFLTHLAEEAAQQPSRLPPAPAVAQPRPRVPPLRILPARTSPPAQASAAPHLVLRIDALPPYSAHSQRLYWCPRCDRNLTGAELRNLKSPHEIADRTRTITEDDLKPEPEPRAERAT